MKIKTIEQLQKLAIKEASLLRVNTTKKQLGKLDVSWLSATMSFACIYGQMTGDCDSNEAKKLMLKCCPFMIEGSGVESVAKSVQEGISIDAISTTKSAKFVKSTFLSNERLLHYFSPIEVLLFTIGLDERGALIDYIKGNTDKLAFTKK